MNVLLRLAFNRPPCRGGCLFSKRVACVDGGGGGLAHATASKLNSRRCWREIRADGQINASTVASLEDQQVMVQTINEARMKAFLVPLLLSVGLPKDSGARMEHIPNRGRRVTAGGGGATGGKGLGAEAPNDGFRLPNHVKIKGQWREVARPSLVIPPTLHCPFVVTSTVGSGVTTHEAADETCTHASHSPNQAHAGQKKVLSRGVLYGGKTGECGSCLLFLRSASHSDFRRDTLASSPFPLIRRVSRVDQADTQKLRRAWRH